MEFKPMQDYILVQEVSLKEEGALGVLGLNLNKSQKFVELLDVNPTSELEIGSIYMIEPYTNPLVVNQGVTKLWMVKENCLIAKMEGVVKE